MTGLAGALPAAIRARAHLLTALAVLGAAWCWQIATLQAPREWGWLGLTAFSVITGFAALGWLRPARVGFTAPQAMMLLGTAGMLAGLGLDVQRAGLQAIVSVCAAHAPDFLAVARVHLAWLPCMHIGMFAGGIGALVWLRRARPHCRRQFCARLAQNIACSTWMLLGMAAGVVVYYRFAAWLGGMGVPAMLGGMIGGMVWGMVVSVALYRLYASLRVGGSPREVFRAGA